MKKNYLITSLVLSMSISGMAQFATTAANWNVPDVESLSEDMDAISGTNHAMLDINGDGYPDLIDTEDNVSNLCWQTGFQRYWKVYYGNGTSISSTAVNWNVPDVEALSEDMDAISGTNHAMMDINGDGYPDLIDTEDNVSNLCWQTGFQRYWKVYLNNGTSISSTAVNWNVPDVESLSEDMDAISGTNHAMMDINGDGYPDLIDTEDNISNLCFQTGFQRYWKVYVNNGSSISSTAVNWNVPDVESLSEDMDQISGTNHAMMDFNGDGYPDLIDTEDNISNLCFQTGFQRYWKVYVNNGSSISSTAVNWNVPDVESLSEDMDQISGTNHAMMDIDGDGYPDLIDTEDNVSNLCFQTGFQRYWKVYSNNGSSISSTAVNWNVPDVEFLSEDMDQISGTNHAVFDMNGDGFPDLIDTEDNTSNLCWQTGFQRYWKVYLNLTIPTGAQELDATGFTLTVAPNPTEGKFNIDLTDLNDYTVSIYNTVGMLIHQGKKNNDDRYEFDLSTYDAGIYFVKIISNDQVQVARVIKK